MKLKRHPLNANEKHANANDIIFFFRRRRRCRWRRAFNLFY